MQFSKLKLTGFKSFVDPTELLIEPGMTGIVGPNGCGKSNLVEALRWVMGESSAKQMRGGGMDDVIFNGTSTRPRRNIAEVALTLENDGHDVGDSVGRPILNEAEEVVVARRIEREKGSGYKLNGADIRARDIQLLFADHASGARSPALVSQGRVGAIINAKPADRRKILEDAAGVSGLHSRRHEAELRLKAAMGNLQRLEDVTGTIESQLNSLLRQARQARRYNVLNENVRRLDALRLYIRWMEAVTALHGGEEALRQAETTLAEATRIQSAAQRERDDAISKLPSLRTKDAQSRARLNQIESERERFELDTGRKAERHAEELIRANQIAGDMDRETRLLRDMEQALIRLDDEKQALLRDAETVTSPNDLKQAAAAQQQTVDACQQDLDAVSSDLLAARNNLQAWQDRKSNLEREWADLQREADELVRRQAGHIEQDDDEETLLTARIDDLTDSISEIRQAIQKSEEQQQAFDAARDKAEQALDTCRQTHQEEFASLQQTLADEKARLEACQAEADQAWEKQRHIARDAEDRLKWLDREIADLSRLLAGEGEGADPVLMSLDVEPGYETALAIALGDALDAPVLGPESDAPFVWRETGRLDERDIAPAGGCENLATKISGAGVLTDALQAVWIVQDAEQAGRMQADLPRGVSLVSREGGLWRWDGYVIAPGAPTAAAQQLERKNMLATNKAERIDLVAAVQATAKTLADCQQQLEAARQALARHQEASQQRLNEVTETLAQQETKSRQIVLETRQRLEKANADVSALRQRERQCTAELEETRKQQEAILAIRHELIAAEAALQEQRKLLDRRRQDWSEQSSRLDDEALDPSIPDLLEAEQVQKRQRLILAREELREKEALLDRYQRDMQTRQDRLAAILEEQESREARRKEAATHLEELGRRRQQLQAALKALDEDPDKLAARRAGFLHQIEAATTERDRESAALAEAENQFVTLDTALKNAGEDLTLARENRIRAEAGIEQARQTRNQIGMRIAEDLQSAPHELWKIADIEAGTKPADLPPLEEIEADLEKQRRQRDSIGPVNLRAEVEAEELKTQMGSLLDEKTDLEAAIEKLHEAIDSLNAEGRQRLLAAFEKVDSNFGSLFRRLFGGGRAHLTLVESDDPLNAGLEIMASPPGKKLTTLSLLSGGEQALTATALLFGVFLTNPAPICVLDEVDAPLDDANTERFATLIEEIVKLSGTRFLVVTHNPLTMARMHRLYGVTMSERGVSRMLSVDLERAEELVDHEAA